MQNPHGPRAACSTTIPTSAIPTSARTGAGSPACVDRSALFQDRLLEEPPAANAPVGDRRRYAVLEQQATEVCAGCPLRVECLYAAVVDHDVAGFAGGTTQRQRAAIRRRLRIAVPAEDFDTLAGVTGPNRQVDHDEVIRLRDANPQESLECIARRLGCSLSTVKRHLRRARREASDQVTPIGSAHPARATVLSAAADVLRLSAPRQRAA